MGKADSVKLNKARELMDGFSQRTGLEGDEGDIRDRYLWTDAFAVQNFFALWHATKKEAYKKRAFQLIDQVHQTLGRYHPDDKRKGWISGLSEEEGAEHPTAGGLRIGKKMLERGEKEAFHERLEWERDGQYFHYITRWVSTLLKAEEESGEHKYALWAAELVLAGGSFVHADAGRLRMYWKMSVDLSRPLVASMGAHDPLEGLIWSLSTKEAAPEKAPELELLSRDFIKLCEGHDWSTSDPLGIGGLLLDTRRAAKLATKKEVLPESIRPEKLLAESLHSLRGYARLHEPDLPAYQRLAFRECGLSLGLRALYSMEGTLEIPESKFAELEKYMPLANDIEDFWLEPDKQKVRSWTEHLDINAVTLAASLLANEQSVYGW